MSASAEKAAGTVKVRLGQAPTGHQGSAAARRSWADVPVRAGGPTVGTAHITQEGDELVGTITLTNPALASKLSTALDISIGPTRSGIDLIGPASSVQHSQPEGSR